MKLVLNLLKGLIKLYALLHSTEQCTGIKCILPSGRILRGILKKKNEKNAKRKELLQKRRSRVVVEIPSDDNIQLSNCLHNTILFQWLIKP